MDDPLAPEGSLAFVDEDVLRWVAADDVGPESPYSQFGTLVAKARTLVPFLVDVARDRGLTDHGAVARECGVHAARQGALLRIVGHHEAVLGRPPLPALVTKADRETPGKGYFELVEAVPNRSDDVPDDPAERRWLWETQRDAVYRTWAVRERASRAGDCGPTPPKIS